MKLDAFRDEDELQILLRVSGGGEIYCRMADLYLSLCRRAERFVRISVYLSPSAVACLCEADVLYVPRCLQPCRMKAVLVVDETQMQAACGESVSSDLSLWGPGHREVCFHEGDRCTGGCLSL